MDKDDKAEGFLRLPIFMLLHWTRGGKLFIITDIAKNFRIYIFTRPSPPLYKYYAKTFIYDTMKYINMCVYISMYVYISMCIYYIGLM